MGSLDRHIRDVYDRLPASERRLADVVLEKGGSWAAYSATELAESAGVSKATAARLVRRLGFASFQEMRHQTRDEPQSGSPLAELSGVLGLKGTLDRHLGHDRVCLTQTLETVRGDDAAKAVRLLTEAPRIWVVGFRNSHALALYARELLVQVKADVRLLPMVGQTLAEELSAMTAGDVVLAIGFRRRPAALSRVLNTAVETRAPVILLGDPSLGETAGYADVTFRCLSRGASLFDSYVAPVSLINYLCSSVALALGEPAQARLKRTEGLHEVFGDFKS